MKRLIVVVALALAGCREDVVPPGPVAVAPDPGASTSPVSAEAGCRALGNVWVQGLAGPVCAQPTPDAGQPCTASDDCTGLCLARGRVCSPHQPYFGCHELYENGETPTICVD